MQLTKTQYVSEEQNTLVKNVTTEDDPIIEGDHIDLKPGKLLIDPTVAWQKPAQLLAMKNTTLVEQENISIVCKFTNSILKGQIIRMLPQTTVAIKYTDCISV